MTTDYTKALIDSLSHEQCVSIDYVEFTSQNAKLGRSQHTAWADFADVRKRYAEMPFDGDKADLPAQMGAITSSEDDEGPELCGKRETDVQGHTWLFIDCDNGGDPTKLLKVLVDNNVAFLITESSTSRVGGNPLKWHLFLPLQRPVIYQAGGDVAARKGWWMAAAHAAKQAILAIGGIAGSDDKTSNTINRIAYVPHLLPFRESPVSVKASTDFAPDNRCVDLTKFLQNIGFAEPFPPSHKAPEGRTYKDPDAPEATASSTTTSVTTAPTTTPGETTGTLLHKVFAHTGRILHKISGGFAVACPWEDEHSSGAGSSTSTVIFLRGEGGFECKHSHCEGRQAADVLSWARRNHVPLPDREIGGVLGASVVDAIEEAMASETGEADPVPTEAVAVSVAATAATATVAVAAAPTALVAEAVRESFKLAPATTAPPPTTPPQKFEYPKERVEIEITNEITDMRDAAAQAITSHPYIVVAYKQGTPMLCDLIAETDVTGRRAFAVRKLSATHLKAELCRVSTWFARSKDGEKQIKRPDDTAVATLLACGTWPDQRRIRGIVGTPVFRPNGTLIQVPGHDPSGIFFDGTQCSGLRRVSEDPSVADCQLALSRMRYVIKDFPFANPDLAASVWLSAIFTKLLRFSFVGNVPLFSVTAGASGSGKGKLAATAAIIASGKVSDSISGHLAGEDQGPELEREIGTHITGGDGTITIDNVSRNTVVGGPVLESYLTTPTFTTRRIGTSDKIRQEKSGFTDLQLWVTGNDLQLSADMTRRSLIINIEDLSGDPTARVAEQSDLEGYVTAHRNELLAHALTLLSGFFAARRRGWKVNLPEFASFEAWSIVRQAVVWCGLPDPFLARGKAAMSPEDIAFGQLAAHLHKMIGTAATLVGKIDAQLAADATARKPQHPTFRAWLADEEIKIGSQGKSLGKAIKQHVGKVAVLPSGKFKLHLTKGTAGSTVQLVPV